MTVKPPIELDDLECEFKEEVLEKVPDALLDLCLTCGTCTGGCPASGLMDMDPRKLLRMVNLGMDEEVKKSKWAWVCTMCARCVNACPMKINIPKLVYNIRGSWPRAKRPKGIRGSCDQHIRPAMPWACPPRISSGPWKTWPKRSATPNRGFKDMQVTVDRAGPYMAINQNSREPVTEPDELSPLWKILHLVGADWTYPSVMWAGENYCMFMADEEGWRYISGGVRLSHRQYPGM
jgi:ferredoxin